MRLRRQGSQQALQEREGVHLVTVFPGTELLRLDGVTVAALASAVWHLGQLSRDVFCSRIGIRNVLFICTASRFVIINVKLAACCILAACQAGVAPLTARQAARVTILFARERRVALVLAADAGGCSGLCLSPSDAASL